MRFQMGGVDHQPGRFAGLARQFGKNLVEHAEAAPAHEPIVDRLMRAYSRGASRQRRPFLMTKTIRLMTRRSSTLATPCDNGKYGSIRRICASVSRNKSSIAAPPSATDKSAAHASPQEN